MMRLSLGLLNLEKVSPCSDQYDDLRWKLIIVRRAALDVFTNEPEIHPGLINDYRVVSPSLHFQE